MSGTNRKITVVWRAASQVQGDADLLGKAFWLGKVHVVAGMMVDDLLECSYWSSIEVVEYNCVSEHGYMCPEVNICSLIVCPALLLAQGSFREYI